jgi:DNA-nicking Smr family endonuclease
MNSEKPPFDPPDEAFDDEERRLFLEAMAHLDSVPDKDLTAAARQEPVGVQQWRPSKSKRVEPEARLDLHGKTVPEAVRALRAFLSQAQADELKVVLVITGKGQRSPGGAGVLKGKVEAWIRGRGAPYLRAYSEAPRALGGRGAYVCYLKRPPAEPDVAY